MAFLSCGWRPTVVPLTWTLGVTAMLTLACARPTADVHFRKANAYLEDSRLSEAILEYRLALEAEPRRGDIRFKLADAYIRNRDASSGLKEYLRAADLLPRDAGAQVKAGNVLLLARRFEDAKTRSRMALAIDPENVDAQILLGNALAGLKDIDGAMAEFQEAIVMNPASDDAYMNIGSIQIARGTFGEAESSFRKAIEVAPRSMTARLALANFLWSSGRIPEAERMFLDTLALEPGNLDANRALGLLYIASNRAKAAEPFFSTIAKTAKTTEGVLALVDYYGMMKRYNEARQLLEDLASREASYPVATLRLAAIDAAQQDRASALQKVRQLLEKHAQDGAAHLLAARLLLADGKRDEALAEAREIVTSQSDTAEAGEAFMLIGGISASYDHREEAIKAYREVLRLQDGPFAAELALAALYLAGGELDSALMSAQQARAISPGSPLARALIVRVLLADHNWQRAEDELTSLKKEYPRSATVQNLLATQQLAIGQTANAQASYMTALQLEPRNLEATAGLARLLLVARRTKEAVSLVERALDAPSQTGDFAMLAAQTYATAGQVDKAEMLLKKAIELEPARLQAYSLLGGLYIRQNRIDDAIEQFGRVVEQNPTSVPANTMLGMLLEAQVRFPEAERQYQKVLSIDSHAAVAANNLAWRFASRHTDLDRALELAQTALHQVPDDPYISDTLGWVYYHKNLIASAIQYLELSVRKSPAEPAMHYHLGMAYWQAGELNKARHELETALAFRAAFEGIEEARRKLEELTTVLGPVDASR